jgi:hypothetical protein
VVGPTGPAGQDGATADPVQVTNVETTNLKSTGTNNLNITSAFLQGLNIFSTGVDTTNGGVNISATGAPVVIGATNGQIARGSIILKTNNGSGSTINQVVVNQQGLALATSGGQYLNMNGSYGEPGYGLRGNDGTTNLLEVKNTFTDDWGQPYHSNAVSGQGVYWEGVTPITLASPSHILTTGFNSVPSIVTTYLECASADAGYVVGDHVMVSSMNNLSVGSTGFSLIFDGAAANDVTVRIGTGDMYLIHKTTGTETRITNAKWQMRIKAWK